MIYYRLMSSNLREGARRTPDFRDRTIIGPTRSLEEILDKIKGLDNARGQYIQRTGDSTSFKVKFTEGAIKALLDFIEIDDMGTLKGAAVRVADTYRTFGRYVVLRWGQRKKLLAEDPEKEGMWAGYKWVLRRKGAKLPLLLQEESANPKLWLEK